MRTKEMEERYREYQKTTDFSTLCNLCHKTITVEEFKFWKITNNLFPWDKIAEIQHMAMPKRHVTFNELNEEEKREYENIKLGYIEENYDIIAEATNKKKSIPGHFHLHLINVKD